MKTLVVWTIVGLAVIMGIMLFPTIHGFAGTWDISGYFPVLGASFTLMPYAFLGLVAYFVWKLVRR